ncbi:hypothetical protein V5O48_005427 [Marasmius crinis-equi]|uniref:ABM domain-containing protein n=1 Tax=Marasmius crinis-equi TaxID=585013 RepID=A0ABR3FMB2_9AGAR
MPPITELITLEVPSPYTIHSPPLSRLIMALSARQCTYSAYPVTLYADITSPNTFYLLTGWSNCAALAQWGSSENAERRGIFQSLEEYARVTRTLYLDMDFDTIPGLSPGGKPRVLCILRNSISEDEEEESGPDTEIAISQYSSGTESGEEEEGEEEEEEEEELCRIEWTGGGHRISKGRHGWKADAKVFHRFVMYGEDTSEHALRGRFRSREFTAMKRISISAPSYP